MHWLDWLIVTVPVAGIIYLGWYAKRYIRSVSDYLSAGRLCGRYVICASDVANALAIIGLVAYAESQYKCGFGLFFWMNLVVPVTMIMSLTGYCIYRFRETRAMSMGQFLEMRYNRALRIFAALLRSFCEVLANAIMPAVAARFFIYFLGLPHHFFLFGIRISTMLALILLCLTVAIAIIYMGGTLSMVLTDALQGVIFFPTIVIFIFFILYKFDWGSQIVPVLTDRAAGESFIDPYDISRLRDFNLFAVLIIIANRVFHRASWYGAGLYSAARTPHEQKMAGVLGAWREHITAVFHVLIALALITLFTHRDFAVPAQHIRQEISQRISEEVIDSESARQEFNRAIAAVPPNDHKIGVDAPYAEGNNADTPVLETAHRTLLAQNPGNGNGKFLRFRTLYHQMMLAVSMRQILPCGLMGLFLLLMIMAMVSTDNTRIFSAAVTFAQDVILPFKKKPFTLKGHICMLRMVSIGIGVIYVIGSVFMEQLDYIQLFVMIATSLWLGGCAPVMIFGLYSRFGTTAGAFASLIGGMVLSLLGIFAQRNWADRLYPYLERNGMVETLDYFLQSVSSPLNPYVVWKMNPVTFPVNSYELFFLISLITLFLYCIVSLLTMKEPFNLDAMLHRGAYRIEGDAPKAEPVKRKHSLGEIVIGITPEYTLGDKIISWSLFIQSFVWGFGVTFVMVVLWNLWSPWPVAYWSCYFYITVIWVPLVFALVSVFWFGIGGVRDLLRMFRDLRHHQVDLTDDGSVHKN